MSDRIRLDVWSDVVCPFCYLVAPELTRLARERAGDVQLVWRAFELSPEPAPPLDDRREHLEILWKRALVPLARERGLHPRFPAAHPRSRLAHEAIAEAREQGQPNELPLVLTRAFFEEGADIGRAGVIVELGRQAGLDPSRLEQALTDHRHRAIVESDQRLARDLGLTGVPVILRRREGDDWLKARIVVGAQPDAVLRALLDD